MSFGFVEVDYFLVGPYGKYKVHGVQIGRFGVHQATPDSPRGRGLPLPEAAPWGVGHIPSGIGVGSFATFDEAYALADDISRFSKKDPSGKTMARLKEQLGDQIMSWLFDIVKPYEEHGTVPVYIPYREWLAEQGKTWKPRRRRMKPLFGR